MRGPAALTMGALLVTAGAASAYDLISHGNLTARTDGNDWCKARAKIVVDAPDEGPFAGDRLALQRLVGGVRAILDFECPESDGVMITGRVDGETVYRGLAGAVTEWTLMHLPLAPTDDPLIEQPTAVAAGEPEAPSDLPEPGLAASDPPVPSMEAEQTIRPAEKVSEDVPSQVVAAEVEQLPPGPTPTALEDLLQARKNAEEEARERARTLIDDAGQTGLLGDLAQMVREHGLPETAEAMDSETCLRAVNWLSGTKLVYVELGDGAPELVPVLAGAWVGADKILGRSPDQITEADARLWSTLGTGCMRLLAHPSIPADDLYREAVFEMTSRGVGFSSPWPLSEDTDKRQRGVDAIQALDAEGGQYNQEG